MQYPVPAISWLQDTGTRQCTDRKSAESIEFIKVVYRSQYKIPVYAYNALRRTASQPIEQLVAAYHPTRSLRSESEVILTVPQTRSLTCSGNVEYVTRNPSTDI